MNYQIIILITILVAAIIFVSFFFSKKARIKRKLKKAVVKKISNFSNGEIAKVVGKVEIIGTPLISPLSGRPCAYYYVHIEQQVSTGKSSHWKTIIEEEVAGKFVIKDGHSFAYINSNNIKSYIVQDRKFTSGFRKDATEVLEKYLRAHGFESEGFLGFNKTLRYTEGILEEGEEIAVLGKGEWKGGYHYNLPDIYDKVLAFSSAEEEQVYLSDDPTTTINKEF